MDNPMDPSDMRSMIANFGAQFKLGSYWAKDIIIPAQIETVVVSGMGGSALPTDIVNLVFGSILPKPIILNRTYSLDSRLLTANTLVIACSFSGNTEETLSVYDQAVSAHVPTLAVAGGGELINRAQANGLPFVKLTKESPNFQPRMGSGYFFGALAQVLNQIGWISQQDLTNMLTEASALDPSALENEGKQIAEAIGSKIPVFYSADHFWPVARISKIKVNENAKTPAFWNYLPEANHNEMVGYSQPNGNYIAIMLVDPAEDARINQRFEIMGKLLQNQVNIPYLMHNMIGDSVFAKTFNTLIIADWASYHLALAKNIDPTPVAMVEDFKQLVVK